MSDFYLYTLDRKTNDTEESKASFLAAIEIIKAEGHRLLMSKSLTKSEETFVTNVLNNVYREQELAEERLYNANKSPRNG
jgi:hypothetical protein